VAWQKEGKETWSAGILPATTSREQDAPTTFKTMVLKIDVVYKAMQFSLENSLTTKLTNNY
jgi:hypothetical protein